ncbi:MAG: hypothetical protein IK093_05805 [Ruminiclostridium sp.]|nr:hypothetical protein [Ruminiclostridium sp.]
MYFIRINGVTLPTPVYYSVTSDDIPSADSGRSDETGVTHRNRIRHSVKTCDVKWRLPGSSLGQLGTSLGDELLDVELLDPGTGGYTSCDMYAASIKSDFYQQQNGDELLSWWEISCRLTEY